MGWIVSAGRSAGGNEPDGPAELHDSRIGLREHARSVRRLLGHRRVVEQDRTGDDRPLVRDAGLPRGVRESPARSAPPMLANAAMGSAKNIVSKRLMTISIEPAAKA